MKKLEISQYGQTAVAWFFCGFAFMLLLFVLGVMSNHIKII